MDSGKDIQHYFHANASAWGGRFDYPIDVTLPVIAPTALPSVGGYLQAEHDAFKVDGAFSIERAYTEVSGTRNPLDGSFDTIVTATIEGVAIADSLFAKKVTMQLTTNHPPNGYFPTVSFKGTVFDGLRTNDCELTPELDLGVFSTDRHPDKSWLYNPKLRKFAIDQSKDLASGAKAVSGKKIPFFDRLLKRHSGDGPNSEKAVADRGNIICTVVKNIKITGNCKDTTAVGNTLHIPTFGRIILGELIVDGNSFNLTMMRLDMGSNAKGQGSGPQGGANGTNTGGT